MNNIQTNTKPETIYDPTKQHATTTTTVDKHDDSHEKTHGTDTSHEHDETDQHTHDENE